MAIDGRSYVRNGPRWPWHVEVRDGPDYVQTACRMRLDKTDSGHPIKRSIEPDDGPRCTRCMEAIEAISGEGAFLDG